MIYDVHDALPGRCKCKVFDLPIICYVVG